MIHKKQQKITLSVAGKFHAISLAKEYAKRNVLSDLYCISRKFEVPFGIPKKSYHNRIDLAWYQAIGSRIPINIYSHKTKNYIFDAWIKRSLINKEPGILHGWNGCSYETFKTINKLGWKTCVERSCPHNQVQHDLLTEEADLIGVNYIQDKEKLAKQIEELYLADTIVCPSSYSASSYTDPELIKKVKCVSLGSNFKYRERNSSKKEGLRILMVGNSFLRKGTHYLIEAMKQIDDPKAELWIRGEIPAAYRERIKDPRIKIFDAVSADRLKELYQTADVFVQPSIDEGFGMTVLEALSFGLPLVVTENVGAKDVLNNKVATVVPIRDASALANGILSVQHKADSNFDKERTHIINTYTWARCADKMIKDVYGIELIS